jgi:hypothetical protein
MTGRTSSASVQPALDCWRVGPTRPLWITTTDGATERYRLVDGLAVTLGGRAQD